MTKSTSEKRRCFVIIEGQRNENGYIPSVVEEGEIGHAPLLGRGELAEPWYWGQTWEEAQEVCRAANERLGLTPADVEQIRASSITAQLRQDAGRERGAERLRRLGVPLREGQRII